MFDRKTVLDECAIVCSTFFASFMPCEVAQTREELHIPQNALITTTYTEDNLCMGVYDPETGKALFGWYILRNEKLRKFAVYRIEPANNKRYAFDVDMSKESKEQHQYMGYWGFMSVEKKSQAWVTVGNISFGVDRRKLDEAIRDTRRYFC